jgi:hypothetical protein
MQDARATPSARNFFVETRSYIGRMMQLANIASLDQRKNASHPLFAHLRWLETLLSRRVSDDGHLMLDRLGPGENETRQQLFEILAAQCAYGYDRMYWQFDGYFEELISQSANREFIHQRLRIPELFDATISELFYWGWLKVRGFDPELQQFEGMPDIRLICEGKPIFCDVKTIMPGTPASRVKRLIEKTNKQIKRAGPNGVGLCLLRVLKPCLRTYQTMPSDDEVNLVPTEIQPIIASVSSIMESEFYKSVARTIIVWEERMSTGAMPGWVNMLARRCPQSIDHKRPRLSLKRNRDLEPKATIAFNIDLSVASSSASHAT